MTSESSKGEVCGGDHFFLMLSVFHQERMLFPEAPSIFSLWSILSQSLVNQANWTEYSSFSEYRMSSKHIDTPYYNLFGGFFSQSSRHKRQAVEDDQKVFICYCSCFPHML